MVSLEIDCEIMCWRFEKKGITMEIGRNRVLIESQLK